MPKKLDTYQQWEQDGVLKKILKEIEDLTARKITQVKMCKQLGVSERTFIGLKRKYSKIRDAIYKGRERLKEHLINSMFELAVGAESEKKNTKIEKDSQTGRKKEHISIVSTKDKPNFQAIRYLLITTFGRDYNEKKRELDIMEKRLSSKEETWKNGSDSEENE